MAVQLRAAGHAIAFLGMLDTPTPPSAIPANSVGDRLRSSWRELRFLAQILTQAGPMTLDACFVLFAGEARFHNNVAGQRSLPERLRRFWSNALLRWHGSSVSRRACVGRNARFSRRVTRLGSVCQPCRSAPHARHSFHHDARGQRQALG